MFENGSNHTQRGEFLRRRWRVWLALAISAFWFATGIQRSHGLVESRRAVLIELRRPLVDLSVVSAALDLSREKLFQLIESGAIRNAFNLSVLGRKRVCVRVLSRSVIEYRDHHSVAAVAGPLEFQAVVREIFPAHGKSITSAEICRAWSVDEDHPLNLWRAGWLRLAKGSSCHVGRNGTPAFEFISVASFLFQRRIS